MLKLFEGGEVNIQENRMINILPYYLIHLVLINYG